VCKAAADGFEALRQENRIEWNELWKGRVIIDAPDDRWQQLADAAFFYLNTSVHPSAPASTSIYGLAQWNDYHYYYGHVMWDVDLFCVPPLILCQPDAARSLLEYRHLTLASARTNAKLFGRQGIQFPWESGPLHGEESAPGAGKASWHEDHVTTDIAWSFMQFANVTGDDRFRRELATPVVFGVADWIASRVSRTRSGYAFRDTMGVAERTRAADNDAFTVMGAKLVLSEAIRAAEAAGIDAPRAWAAVMAGLQPPRNAAGNYLISHEGFRPNEEKGATPGPLAGFFPLGYEVDPATEKATLDYHLRLAPEYIGSPMLSAFYVVWAAWFGDRRMSARLLEEGYGRFIGQRFLQTLEIAPGKEPDKPDSGPFFANLAGFLMALMYGLPGLRVSSAEPASWPVRPVVLPAGWRSVEIERAWVRQQPARIVARQGDQRALLEVGSMSRRQAA
jgi:hypothetical protein